MVHREVLVLLSVVAASCTSDLDSSNSKGAHASAEKPAPARTVEPAGSEPPADMAAARPALDKVRDGFCSLEVTGAVTDHFEHIGGSTMAFGSDYWRDGKWQDLSVKVSLFWFNCGKSSLPYLVTLSAQRDTEPDDLPYAPGKFALPRSGHGKPGAIEVSMVSSKAHDLGYEGKGALTLTQFDDSGIAGTFVLQVRADGKDATINGAFRYPCTVSSEKCRK